MGGEATPKGIFLRVVGLGSSKAIEKGIGSSSFAGYPVNGVKGGLSLSLAYLSSIMGYEFKFCKFLKTLSIDVSSFRGKG